jgi:hypothetical protein
MACGKRIGVAIPSDYQISTILADARILAGDEMLGTKIFAGCSGFWLHRRQRYRD